MASERFRNVPDEIAAIPQEIADIMPTAIRRTLNGIYSETITHGTGPTPIENDNEKRMTPAIANG